MICANSLDIHKWVTSFLCACSVLQILSLQNLIWDSEQAESRRGEVGPQHNQGKLLQQPACVEHLHV